MQNPITPILPVQSSPCASQEGSPSTSSNARPRRAREIADDRPTARDDRRPRQRRVGPRQYPLVASRRPSSLSPGSFRPHRGSRPRPATPPPLRRGEVSGQLSRPVLILTSLVTLRTGGHGLDGLQVPVHRSNGCARPGASSSGTSSGKWSEISVVGWPISAGRHTPSGT